MSPFPKKLTLIPLTTLLVSGCGFFHAITVSDVVGEYAYKYKSGEIEVWSLRPDFTYQQEFYKTVQDYHRKRNVEYPNTGTWTLSENKTTYINNKMVFSNTLDFYDYSNFDRPLNKPLHLQSQPADWYAPSGQNEAKIAVGLDIDYVLYRETNRDLVKDDRTNP